MTRFSPSLCQPRKRWLPSPPWAALDEGRQNTLGGIAKLVHLLDGGIACILPGFHRLLVSFLGRLHRLLVLLHGARQRLDLFLLCGRRIGTQLPQLVGNLPDLPQIDP